MAKTKNTPKNQTVDYLHSHKAVQRPDVGVQDQFSQKKAPKTYRYDSSLDPSLSWDESRDRDLAEWLIGLVQRCAIEGQEKVFVKPQIWAGGSVQIQSLKAAADLLISLSRPFLNWTGKAERHQISVPTVPLFVHERQSTKAILDGIKYRKAKGTTFDFFSDSNLDVTDKLDAYEHKGPWQNRMILGDSMQVMNSLLEFEGIGGQVQMLFFDPPYGVQFGSNFQPFVRTKNVNHGVDGHMTREPEMVKAYRDTWQLGLHSYLTYLRDRMLLARELLNETGSVFVQISDENLHHVREVLDEIFGQENFIAIIPFRKKTMPFGTNYIEQMADFLIWYGKDKKKTKYRPLFKPVSVEGEFHHCWYELPDGTRHKMTKEEVDNHKLLPEGARVYRLKSLEPSGIMSSGMFDFSFENKIYRHPKNGYATKLEGMERLVAARRIQPEGNRLCFIIYADESSYARLTTPWNDTVGADNKSYVVQTNTEIIKRCLLMTTDPGDLVLDPTCGSGTTAYVAEHWGRRWITCDTSRVPLALARQRLLTAVFPYYELKNQQAGPQEGFVYKRKQNRKGEEIGGLAPRITLGSIANDEQPSMDVLVDRPEILKTITRVAGPFVVEATIAPAQTLQVENERSSASIHSIDGTNTDFIRHSSQSHGDPAVHIERMTLVLRQSKTLRLPGNRELVLADIRRISDSDILHAEGMDADGNRIAVVFGPEDGAISSDVVFEAAREAYFLKFPHLYFFGFAIQAKARELIEERSKLRIPCTYVTVTPDVAMSDLLKTSRASEIFSVTGLPDVEIRKAGEKNDAAAELYEVELKGLDIFNPSTMEQEGIEGQNLPAWMLDIDYDGMCFYASQVFFPKTAAWDNLQKSLRAEFDPSVWEHLAGTVSEPFPIGTKRRVAIKVIDERGNELMRVLEVAV
ncbi:MAG TPA: site-specific DNA-methyltransferase [Herbaspirillum sp.]